MSEKIEKILQSVLMDDCDEFLDNEDNLISSEEFDIAINSKYIF